MYRVELKFETMGAVPSLGFKTDVTVTISKNVQLAATALPLVRVFMCVPEDEGPIAVRVDSGGIVGYVSDIDNVNIVDSWDCGR
ncbi:hypothetical protein MPDQ_006156 [Monascus purpureus]|uniref:Uncharacterized protein n=1 Tax=Monascus purpureus TaxID=5098 RepID=A0A507R6M4_MONPU|nr:hypothetical protein MPDQ_006156 [Monascus purpureus]